MKEKPSTVRVKKHYQDMKAQGLKQVRVWVQVNKEDLLKAVAEAIREGKRIIIEEPSSEGAGTPKPD